MVLEAVLSVLLTLSHILKILSSMNDMVEQLKTMAIPMKSSKEYSSNMGTNVDGGGWGGSIMSSHKLTIFFWVGISIGCVALCIVACWPKFAKKPAQGRSTTSRSRSTHQSVSQSPPGRERSKRAWWKVFEKKGENSTSKGWSALRFTSRSKSQAGDVEMQRVQPARNAGSVAENPILAGPTLRNGTQDTRLQRPERLWIGRSRIEGRRAEAERQRRREAWERAEERGAELYLPDSTPVAPSQLSTYSPAMPESVAQPNSNRIDYSFYPIFDSFIRETSPTSGPPEIPPPTYAEHSNDEIAYLSDYQNPAHAAEEIREVQGLPPYAPVPPHSALRPIVL